MTMITPSYLGETIEYSSLHACRSTLEDPTFVFQERSLSLPGTCSQNSVAPKNISFNMETWSEGGLRYFVIGDASAADIDSLAKLFKAT